MVTHTTDTTTTTTDAPKLPPVWFKHLFWRGHRSLYHLLGDRVPVDAGEQTRLGRHARDDTRSSVRRTAQRHPGLHRRRRIAGRAGVNGWDEGLPAWWLNLEANPDAVIRLKGEPLRPARARRVEGDERDRLWRRWADIDEGLDAYAASRSAETPVVAFEPR
jgi:F420H(2)-dependent quinone reductase